MRIGLLVANLVKAGRLASPLPQHNFQITRHKEAVSLSYWNSLQLHWECEAPAELFT